MRLTEISFARGRPVDGYGPGFFRVGGEAIEGAIMLWPEGLRTWGGYPDLDLPQGIDVLLLGVGAELAHPPGTFRQALEGRGIGVEPMTTPSACRTYNILLAEGRRVALACLPM